MAIILLWYCAACSHNPDRIPMCLPPSKDSITFNQDSPGYLFFSVVSLQDGGFCLTLWLFSITGNPLMKRVQYHFLLLEGQWFHFPPPFHSFFQLGDIFNGFPCVLPGLSIYLKYEMSQATYLITLTDGSDGYKEKGRDRFVHWVLSQSFWYFIPFNPRKTHHWYHPWLMGQ